MLDVVVRRGTVVDGTGAAPVAADVGLQDGRIAVVTDPGDLDREDADRVIDAHGLVVAPGFVDIHTHYDAQVLWDPTVSPSPLHGVTTVIGGNCGFSIAPLSGDATDADYVMRMMARVEGIPLDALRAGPAWDWRTFGEYLARLDGRLAVNAGFLVGHSTVRRLVMGDAAVGEPADAGQIAAMAHLVHAALADGALGFSSSLGEAHTDGDGRPVPSRAAQRDEFLALARAVRDHAGTTLEFIAAMGEIPAERSALMADMSLAADRPLNWNLLGSLSPTEIWEQQLTACDHAREVGAHVVGLTLPDVMRLRATSMLEGLPGWGEVLALPDDARRRAVHDPAVRDRLREGVAEAERRGIAASTRWELVEVAEIPEAADPALRPLVGRTIAAIAAERGVDPLEVVLDTVVPDRLPLTLVFPSLVPSLGPSDAGWVARAQVWQDDRVVLGGSDAGAHVDLMCHANYPTVVLGEAVRDRGLLSVAAAVRLMTEVPARLYGLRGRGRVAEGWTADLVLFDPAAVATGPAATRHDLPGGAARLFAGSAGVEHVLVGGEEVVVAGAMTAARPGTVLRSGRDTDTVTVPGPHPR
jgi:N-acyl-D-aspartate/D-glutamate deacylase